VHVRKMVGVSWVLLLLAAAAGCGRVHAGESSGHGDRRVVQTSARDRVTLTEGYGPITILAGDPNGNGVWFWDSTKTELSVFRINSQGNVTAWPISGVTEFQAISGFAVTAPGIVWLGINSTLSRLDSASGASRTWQIPAPADNPAAESYQPADLKSQHLVQGTAVAPDGKHVAIAMSDASSVQLFDVSAGTFTQISMPTTSDDPVAVAYSPDGTLGVALANYTTHREDSALIIRQGDADSTTVVPVADSSSITSDGTSGFILGSGHPSLVSTAGKVTPIAVPAVPLSSDHPGTAINVMPNGDLAAITSTGVIEFPGDASSAASATSASLTLQLPAMRCQPNAGSYELGTRTSACHPQADVMAVDAAGGVWVVPGTGGARVERLVGKT